MKSCLVIAESLVSMLSQYTELGPEFDPELEPWHGQKIIKIRNEGFNMFRKFFANIYVLNKYTKRITKNKTNNNVRCLYIFQL